ncbi:MAG: NYN domain-containing protein [Opitutales bacterium]|nr:NYN domain-containing protein [Opitutales bacterium]
MPNAEKQRKHLLVDGWNIIRSHRDMARAFAELGQDAAKRMLSDMLSPIHDILGYRVTIVYDGRGDDINVEKIGRSQTFSEVYTPSCMTADELIEQMCATSKTPSLITVASRDNLIRLTAMGFKVESITSFQLFGWAADAAKLLARKSGELKSESAQKWREASSPFCNLPDILNSKKDVRGGGK